MRWPIVATLALLASLAAANDVIIIIGDVPEPAPSGSYPANNPAVWGHLHPSCPAVSGTCASTAGTGVTIENCNAPGSITVTGNNVTIQCVNWTSESGSGALEFGTDIRDLRIDRVTIDGGGVTEVSDLIKISSTKGTGNHTVQVRRSVFRGHRVAILLGGGKLDKDTAALTDYPGFAFAATENIFEPPEWDPSVSPHSEHVALVETADGVLIQHNVFDCDGTHNSSNPCNTAQMLGQPSNGGLIQNVTIDENRFIDDNAVTNGYTFTFDGDKTDVNNCVEPITFTDNVIETGTTVGRLNAGACGNFSTRTGSTCTGNTEDGSPWSC